jgi:hypothetical protein
VDHVHALRLHARIRLQDVALHRFGYGDHPVGSLDPDALTEAGNRVAAAQLLDFPGAERLQAVRRHHVRDAVGQLRQVAGEVRVPGVSVHEVAAANVLRGHEIQG